MKLRYILILIAALVGSGIVPSDALASTRKERRLISKGNDAYKQRNFADAQTLYQAALEENSASAEALYNLGLSQIRQIVNINDTTPENKSKLDVARKNFQNVAGMAKDKPGLAAKANLNLGNIEFKAKEFQKAVDYYKQALRIDPNDDKARKNLRIAQLNLKNQQNQQNQDNQNQNQDQKNQDKNKDQQQDKERNQDRENNQDKDKEKEKQQDNNISKQSAERILKAVDNKESATRARVSKGNEKSENARSRNMRRW